MIGKPPELDGKKSTPLRMETGTHWQSSIWMGGARRRRNPKRIGAVSWTAGSAHRERTTEGDGAGRAGVRSQGRGRSEAVQRAQRIQTPPPGLAGLLEGSFGQGAGPSVQPLGES